MVVGGDFKTIRVEDWYDGRVVAVTLNQPKANILTSEMIGEIRAVLDGVSSGTPQGRPPATRARCRAVVIKAAGQHFSFGASVAEHRAEVVGDMLPRFHGLIRALVNLDVTTVAAVQGQCLGGAFEVVLACDIVVAAASARFGVPEITLGVFPPPASVLLPLKVPPALAHEMIVTGESRDAARLHAAGLVSRVVGAGGGCDSEEDALVAEVRAFLEGGVLPRSASSLRFACRAAKEHLREAVARRLDDIEKLYLEGLMRTRDANEGIQAFLEKRPPKWESD